MKFALTFAPDTREPIIGRTLSQLHLAFKRGLGGEIFQVQLDPEKDDGTIEGLNAFFNAKRAWLIWSNADGEWLYPVNTEHAALEPIEEDCFIENGQLDSYSIAWSHGRERAIRVLIHYFETSALAPWLHWTSEEYWIN